MKTVYLFDKSFTKDVEKAYRLYRRFKDKNSHFFFEPNLLVRTNRYKELSQYLKRHNIGYSIYQYPYPEKKGQFGERKKVKALQFYLDKLFNLQAEIAVGNFSRNDKGFFLNRLSHCFTNMCGISYWNEGIFYLKQGWFYLKLEIKRYFKGFK